MGFSSILGQDRAVSILKRLYEKKVRPSFFLFVGSPGIGKKKAAMEYAKAHFCEQPDSLEGGCDQCDSCGRVARLSHPDLVLLDFSYQQMALGGKQPASSLKIDTVRQALKTLELRPYSNDVSVCVVDCAETLTVGAQNAMLKILEEAPSHLCWIWLVTTEEQILPTILSRTNFKIHFRPLETRLTEQLLMEQFKVPSDRANRVAGLCLGSMERAKNILEMGAAPLPLSPQGSQGVINFSQKEVFSLSQRVARFRNHFLARKSVSEFLEELKIYFHYQWRSRQDRVSLERLKGVLVAQKDLQTNITPALVLEHLLLQFGRDVE